MRDNKQYISAILAGNKLQELMIPRCYGAKVLSQAPKRNAKQGERGPFLKVEGKAKATSNKQHDKVIHGQ